MIDKQEIIWDMRTVRHLAEWGIIFNDEVVRDAGKQGARAGHELRSLVLARAYE